MLFPIVTAFAVIVLAWGCFRLRRANRVLDTILRDFEPAGPADHPMPAVSIQTAPIQDSLAPTIIVAPQDKDVHGVS